MVGKRKKEIEAEEHPDGIEVGEAAQEATEIEFAILNSFYIQDIEKAIKSVRSGEINSGLKAFLSPLRVEDRTDLDSASGLRTLLETLHPTRFNRGRWFSDARRSMSLMQQFAINVVTEYSADAPSLFSINGPPGTGKTTLLQDVFANFIVKRARVLAGLSKPLDAFSPERLRVAFKGGQERTLAVLKPALTEFEMVVASSNNAAVENISGDASRRTNIICQQQAARVSVSDVQVASGRLEAQVFVENLGGHKLPTQVPGVVLRHNLFFIRQAPGLHRSS